MSLYLSAIIIVAAIMFMYACMVFYFYYGWNNIGLYYYDLRLPHTRVSVIVAARNESGNISALIDAIKKQNYPKELFEFILSDDNSTDNTSLIAFELMKGSELDFKLIESKQEISSKKNALATAIQHATGELIITTDADCIMGQEWISSIVNYYEKHNCKMIVGPVQLTGDSFFSCLQQTEFLSVQALTAGSLAHQQPLMCNGANLAYQRTVFFEVNGFTESAETATGDDTFLMFSIAKKYKGQVHYLKSNKAIVSTNAQKTLSKFIHQRIRWASKTFKYKSLFVTSTGILVFAANASIIFLIIISGFDLKFTSAFVLFFLIKFILDALLLIRVNQFFRYPFSVLPFLTMHIIYPFYLIGISIRSQLGTYRWKDRKLKI